MKESKQELSELNVPINVPFRNIEDILNSTIDGVIIEDNESETINFSVEKIDDISLYFEDGFFRYNVPLKIDISTFLGLKASGVLELKFKTNLIIKNDWELIAFSDLESYSWKEAPRVNLLGLSIEKISNVFIDKFKQKIVNSIDENISKSIKLKHLAESMWDEIQTPKLVSDEYGVRFAFIPDSISLSPFSGSNGLASLTVKLKGYSKLLVDDDLNQKPTNLPDLKNDCEPIDDYNLNFRVSLPYDTLSKLANNQLINESFEVKGYSAIIKKVKIYPHNELLIIQTRLEGDVNGVIYLSGVPKYNKQERSLILDNVDFDIETSNFMHRSIARLFKGKIKNKLSEELKYDLKPQIDSLKSVVIDNFNHKEIIKGVFINFSIDSLDVKDVFPGVDGIIIDVTASGKSDLLITDIFINK